MTPEIRFLRRPEVERLTGLCRSAIYARMEAGQFPEAVPLDPAAAPGSAVGWVESEIVAWQRERLAQRDGKGAAKRKARA